jgi:hypothetical protein
MWTGARHPSVAALRSNAGEKTVFLSHFYIKTMILPRQARDKHRENSTKIERFFGPTQILAADLVGALCVMVALLSLGTTAPDEQVLQILTAIFGLSMACTYPQLITPR